MIKNRNKLLIRIGSILACVLLVAGLALPCFALDDQSSNRDVLNQYVVDLGVLNPSYYNLMDALINSSSLTEDQAISTISYLRTGRFDTDREYYVPISIASNLDVDGDGGIDESVHSVALLIEDVRFSVQFGDADVGAVPFITTSLSADILMEIKDNTEVGGGVQASVAIADSTDGSLLVALNCSAQRTNYSIGELVIPTVAFYSLRVDGIVRSDGSYYSVEQIIEADVPVYWSFAFKTVYNAMNDISSVVLGDDFAPVINPRSLLYGWNYGKGVGGATEEDLQDAYNQGYNAGESVAFGEQLLGDSFKTPFEMLRRFTLFEWTDDVGNHHSINLAIVLGAGIGIVLFVWFLKLFAGG